VELKEEKINSILKFDGKMIQLYLDEVRLPNGHNSHREVVKHPGASAVIVTNKDGSIVLEKQYRYPVNEVLWEIPAGKLDGNEDPLECAKRELEEETGFVARIWEKLGYIYTTPGFSDEKIYLFFANELETGNTNPDEDEFVEINLFSKSEVERMIIENKIVDSKTIAAFFRAREKGFLN